MQEIWTPVPLPEFAEDYEVSSQGRLKRVSRCKGYKHQRFIKGECMKKGYIRVHLMNSKNDLRIMIHRLVVMAFIGPVPDGYQINHKDGNKRNNVLENLECVTMIENIHHRDRNGLSRILRYDNHPNSVLTSPAVAAIRHASELGVSARSLAKHYGVWPATIYRVLRYQSWAGIDDCEMDKLPDSLFPVRSHSS